MVKKIILALLLAGFTGVLVWGGVSRTLAKAGENESRGTETTDRGNQGWIENHNSGECEEDGHQGGLSSNPRESAGQGRGRGNDDGAASANENDDHSKTGSE